MLSEKQDAYGHALYEHYKSTGGYEIVERDDGYIGLSGGPEQYFKEYAEWPESEQIAMENVHGKVLDIGCGAGRHALYLQERGHDVTGIDISPRAIQVCKNRGLLKSHVLSITQVSQLPGVFDTIIMMGNNFGLFSSLKRARWLLRRLKSLTTQNAMIIAQSRDPYQTDEPEHLEYHARNRSRGRMSGQVRIRVRYKNFVTPWFDYLMVSPNEMDDILEGTGWKVAELLTDNGASYIATITKI